MKRRIFAILSALSLLLCVVLVSAWCDTRHVAAMLPSMRQTRGTVRALLFLERDLYTEIAIQAPNAPDSVGSKDVAQGLGHLGLMALQNVRASETRYYIRVPYWWLILFTLITPCGWLSVWLRRRRQQRPAAAGCCLKCGYDLRASKERCPECGTAIA